MWPASSRLIPLNCCPFPRWSGRKCSRFGLYTLGDVAVMEPEALMNRFGSAGQKAWKLAQGIDDSPLIPLKHEESIVEHADLPFASASLELLLTAVDTLLRRAFARTCIRGQCVSGAALECVLYRDVPWVKQYHFRQSVSDWQQASRIIRGPTGNRAPAGSDGGGDPDAVRHHRGLGDAVEPAGGPAGGPGATAGRSGTTASGPLRRQTGPVPGGAGGSLAPGAGDESHADSARRSRRRRHEAPFPRHPRWRCRKGRRASRRRYGWGSGGEG